MIHLSILRPRSDSIAARQSRAILAAATRRGEQRCHHRVPGSSPSPRRALRYFLLVLSLLAPLPNRARPDVLRLPFRSVQSMILVEAEIDGDPVTLLMDTGCMKTVISAQAYRARHFTLHAAQRDPKGPGIMGDSVSVQLELRLADYRWVGHSVSIMNMGQLNRLLGTQFDGLLGEDILREFHSVRIDYRAHVIELEN